MIDPTAGWQARILDTPEGFMRDLRTVIVYRREGDDLVALSGWTGDGTPTLTRWPVNTVSPDGVALLMPEGAVEAIAEAVKPGPPSGEVARLEEALKVERARVDDVLAASRGALG